MITAATHDSASRRAALAKARQSRRPSRLGTPAGAAATPDYPNAPAAGFPGLLEQVWQQATAAPDLATAVDVLLTLAGHVPADVQLRALRMADECALKVLSGLSWRQPFRTDERPGIHDGGDPAYHGQIGLTTSGRVVVSAPASGPLVVDGDELIDGTIRVKWSRRALLAYQAELRQATAGYAEQAADSRRWLAQQGRRGRAALLVQLTEAARRTAPFVLYQEDKRYTNFRDRATITGKTLWPGHPDCVLSGLAGMPLDLWSDNDAMMVLCLTLLVRSAGFARIEEANGTQLTVDHVACLLERTRRRYNAVACGREIRPADPSGDRIGALIKLAEALRVRRREIGQRHQLYREIHGVLMHKVERIAGPFTSDGRRRERLMCARLRERFPVSGTTLAEVGASLAASPDWLARTHGDFGSGLESLVYETVTAAVQAFDADFAMSRGIRSLPRLIEALRAQDWTEIARWEIADYFCCVVPASGAQRHFGGSVTQLADMAWSMSARMQYNSWHFIAGNLPDTPEVAARDYFVPPTIPDLAFYSDRHHHGHVAAKVRFSIRSPQQVQVLDRTFTGFSDLRLLRCDGQPFTEQDLLAAHRTSGFIAGATTVAARLAASGAPFEVTAFDSAWHWATIGQPHAERPRELTGSQCGQL